MSIQRASELFASPNPLAPHYTRFGVSERLLLTGHSHQAWPDVAERGQARAWSDAAEYVDGKWERAFERAERVREGFARLLGASAAEINLGASTHDLLVRWLSALPLRARPRVVTSDAEFHSARRLLQRWAEEGLEVVRVSARPAATVGERMAQMVDDSVAAVILSSVFYDSGEIAGGLSLLAERCEHTGTELLIDAYHQLNVVPCSLKAARLERAYIVGGGYKYCQLGEGNAFLRAPADCTLRPAITGWFADFDALEGPAAARVGYGALNARFAGATYDPTSHYRAAEVFDFFRSMNLHPELLREVSQHQIALLRAEIEALDAPPELLQRNPAPLQQIAGFLAMHSPRAAELQRALAARGVLCDVRGETLRFGPAPYLSDEQLRRAVDSLGQVLVGL